MSDGAPRRRNSSTQTRHRRKGATRGGRHGLSRPPVVVAGDDFVIEQPSAVAPPRHRRSVSATPAPSMGISREAEFAYIRADMRRLIIIAAALLALMLVLLLLLNS